MGYSRKKSNIKQRVGGGRGEGVEDIEFPGVLKNEHMKILGGQLKKKWNFQG